MKRKREFFANSNRPSGLPDPPKCVKIEIVDTEEARAIAEATNRVLASGEIVHLEHDFAGPVVAKVGGVEAYRITPADGQRPTFAGVDLDEPTYRHLVDSLGYDDDGSESSSNWREKGRAAVLEAMRTPAPQHGLWSFMACHKVYLDNLASLARWYGLSPAETSAAIGAPVKFPRRTLLPPCGKARALDAEVARQRAEEERKRRPPPAKVAPPKVNSRSLRDLGLQGVLVPLATDPEVQVPRVFAAERAGRNPIAHVGPGHRWKHGYNVEGHDFASAIFAWPAIVGLELDAEALEFAGCRWLSPSYVIEAPEPVLANVPAASLEVVNLVMRLRRRAFPDADRGPIDPAKFGKAGVARAKKILATVERQLRNTAVGVPAAQAWMLPLSIEACVRGCLIHPIETVTLALDVRGKPPKRREGESPPPPFVFGVDELGRMAAASALAGEVTPGSLIAKKGR